MPTCPGDSAPLDCISVSLTSVFVSVPYAPPIEVTWARCLHVLPSDVLSYRHHVGCVTLSVSLYHYNCIGTVYCLPSTSIVVCMPQHRCHNLSSSSWGACPSAVWLLTLFFFAGLLNHSCSWSVYIMSWIVPLFYTILSGCGSKL